MCNNNAKWYHKIGKKLITAQKYIMIGIHYYEKNGINALNSDGTKKPPTKEQIKMMATVFKGISVICITSVLASAWENLNWQLLIIIPILFFITILCGYISYEISGLIKDN